MKNLLVLFLSMRLIHLSPNSLMLFGIVIKKL